MIKSLVVENFPIHNLSPHTVVTIYQKHPKNGHFFRSGFSVMRELAIQLFGLEVWSRVLMLGESSELVLEVVRNPHLSNIKERPFGRVPQPDP